MTDAEVSEIALRSLANVCDAAKFIDYRIDALEKCLRNPEWPHFVNAQRTQGYRDAVACEVRALKDLFDIVTKR